MGALIPRMIFMPWNEPTKSDPPVPPAAPPKPPKPPVKINKDRDDKKDDSILNPLTIAAGVIILDALDTQ